jgi:S1-C subfamily serine protease
MRKPLVAAFFLFVLASILLPVLRTFVTQAQQPVSDGERLAMYSKPAVVRIYDGAVGNCYFQPNPRKEGYSYQNLGSLSSGSGSFISPNGYISTNAHVVSTTHDGMEEAKKVVYRALLRRVAYEAKIEKLTQKQIDFILERSQCGNIRIISVVVVPDGSQFPFEIKAYGAPTGQGKDVAIVKVELKNTPVMKIGDSDKVKIQDKVTCFGYPASAEGDPRTLDDKSALEASITSGEIAAQKSSPSGAPILQVNSTGITHGSSGGPVTTLKGEIVGMITFGGEQDIPGVGFAVTSNTMTEFVKQAGAINEYGPADTIYREGLELYWDGYYSKAIKKFEEVKRLFPQHSEVDKLIQQSQQNITDGKERSSWWFWILLIAIFLVVVVGLILLLGTGVGGLLLYKKRQSQTQTSKQVAKDSKPSDLYKTTPSAQIEAAQAKDSIPKISKPTMSPQPLPDRSATVDLSNIQIPGLDRNTSPIGIGSIIFVAGVLEGQEFDIPAEGCYIGRDSSSSQIVVPDSRISKRHLWIGQYNGKTIIVDSESRNGTFINSTSTPRVTESTLRDGDIVIMGQANVARFRYKANA